MKRFLKDTSLAATTQQLSVANISRIAFDPSMQYTLLFAANFRADLSAQAASSTKDDPDDNPRSMNDFSSEAKNAS